MVTRDKPVYELNLPHVRFSDSLPPATVLCKGGAELAVRIVRIVRTAVAGSIVIVFLVAAHYGKNSRRGAQHPLQSDTDGR